MWMWAVIAYRKMPTHLFKSNTRGVETGSVFDHSRYTGAVTSSIWYLGASTVP